MSEAKLAAWEARRNMSNLLRQLVDDSETFKKMFVGVGYIYDPAAFNAVNIDEFLEEFPKLEPHIKFILSNIGLGGAHRISLLKKLRKIRRICDRPKDQVFDSTRELVRTLLSKVGSAIDGGISNTATRREEEILDITAELTKDVSMSDVTRMAMDVEGDNDATAPPAAEDTKPKKDW